MTQTETEGETTVTVTVNNELLTDLEELKPKSSPSPGQPPSALESMYAGRLELQPRRSIKQFGYEYFLRSVGDDMVGPVQSDYLVQPGDELQITLGGTMDEQFVGQVDRDGSVAMPGIGGVQVAGRRFANLEKVIGDYLRDEANRANVTVHVSIGRLHGFRIHVVGEVARPGIVEVPGRATVLSALALAGGPRKSGSLRRVMVRRAGEVIAEVDLYDFLLSGETNGLDVLQAGDVINVPSIGTTVGVAGYVQRPGIYELPEGGSVADLIDLAGGLTPFTFTPNAQIERTVAGRGRSRIDIALDDAGKATTMGDGELLLIGAVDSERQPLIEISGEVVRPGSYPFRDGMTLRDLLRQADGLTVDAYLPQAFLSRQIGEMGAVTVVPEREAMGTTRRVLVIDLTKAAAGHAAHDVELRPLDHLRIVAKRDAAPVPMVEIIGAVRSPGIYELTAGLTVSQLVAMAGNVVEEVYYDEAELIRRHPDQETKQLGVERYRFDLGNALRFGGADDPLLANGDQLVIRRMNSTSVRVQINGRVRFPGEYVFPEGARISDMIAAAGGVLEDADLRAAVFTRESVRKLVMRRFEDLKGRTRARYQRNLEGMLNDAQAAEGMSAHVQLEQTMEMLERMNKEQSTGRVVIPFTRQDFLDSAYNLSLESGDALRIPARQETVAVVGHVFNPGAFVAEPGIDVGDLIARSGGIQDDGDDERVYVIRADGTVQSMGQEHYVLGLETGLIAGDVVLVPRRPLSRSLGRQLADLLYLGREATEMAYLMSQFGTDSILNFTSVQQGQNSKGVEVLGRDILPK